MGCKTCASNGCGTTGLKTKSGVTGCKNNGGCLTGGCNKMNVFDWLGDMQLPREQQFDIVEVRFKNGRKEFFKNKDFLDVVTGDAVVVEASNGQHLGFVSLMGELVRLQMRKKKVPEKEALGLLRKASAKDLEKFERTQERNLPTMYRTREIVKKMALKMKLSDVEFQADNSKATFYYSADDRVDFRELIKVLAAEFKIRVEMKQISLRQEAGRLGGIGSCGRELCCATWLSDFKSVSTSAARYQNLSLNPAKLSGQCGRLKCCLNYELETYMDALEGIPKLEKPLKTQKGLAKLQKTDIFRKIMWFGYGEESAWKSVSVQRVQEIIDMNERGEVPDTLEHNVLEIKKQEEEIIELIEPKPKKKKKKNRKKRRKGPNTHQANHKSPHTSEKKS